MGEFMIINTGKETWKSAVLALNGTAFRTRIIEPLAPPGVRGAIGAVVIPQARFTDVGGNRFDPVHKEARTLTITCTLLDGGNGKFPIQSTSRWRP